MNTRKFFKLYSLPFLIVLLGIGVYAGVIMLMEQKNLIISKRNHAHHTQIAKGDSIKEDPIGDSKSTQDSMQIAQNTHSSQENSKEESGGIESNKDSTQDIESSQNPTELIGSTLPSTEIESPSQIAEPKELDSQAVIVDNSSTSTSPSQALSQKYGYAKYRINIRQSPSSESAIISRAAVGEALEILSDEQDGWSKVRSRFGVEGYVASRLLTQNLDSQNGEAYIVVANALNVRAKADSQGAVIGRLNHNMRVYVLETQGEWAKIQLPNKQYGYISLNHISKSAY